MYKLGFREAEDSEIKLPTFIGSWRKQRSSRKPSTTASLTMLKPLTVWNTINWKILQEMGLPDHLTCLLRNLYAGQEATVNTERGTTGSIWERSTRRLYIVTLLFQFIFRVDHVTHQANRLDSRLEGHELTAWYKKHQKSQFTPEQPSTTTKCWNLP